eukprot:comp17821_c1_seq1/m.17941 comp17821_c1_seq1/g.17941  ORF comp17821_c1_seq1/g.17941 comp17821_c1_seq1/m.17941 type:complete len:244 (-) comp17821_c1_seq1:311-1042(-)
MGVRYVCLVNLGENMVGTAGADVLQARLEALSAVVVPGVYKVECRQLQRTGTGQQGGQEPLLMLQHSDMPGKRYVMMNNRIMEANEEIEAMMDKVKGKWAQRKTAKIEGQKFQLGDFVIRIGTLTAGNALKGVIAEIEYTACSSISQCTSLLQEFALNIIPQTPGGGGGTNPPTPAPVSTPSYPRVEVKIEADGVVKEEGEGKENSTHFTLPTYDYACVDLSSSGYTGMHTAFQVIQVIKKKW